MKESPKFIKIAKKICPKKGIGFLNYVNRGSFKETFKVEEKSGKFVALKIFDPAMCDLDRAKREINAMIECSSPFIGKLQQFASYKTVAGKKYYSSLEEFFL